MHGVNPPFHFENDLYLIPSFPFSVDHKILARHRARNCRTAYLRSIDRTMREFAALSPSLPLVEDPPLSRFALCAGNRPLVQGNLPSFRSFYRV